MSRSDQIFFSQSRKRWIRFVSAASVIVVLFLVFSGIATVTVLRQTETFVPQLLSKESLAAKFVKPDLGFFYQEMEHHKSRDQGTRRFPWHRFLGREVKPAKQQTGAIRSAFYVNWDRSSFDALRAQVENLQMVFPEWFFLAQTSGKNFEVRVNIDQRALNLMRQSKAKILPNLINFQDGVWESQKLSELLKDESQRQRFVDDVAAKVVLLNFDGINLDFENLPPQAHRDFAVLVKELSGVLRDRGKQLSLAVEASTPSEEVALWAKYADHLVVMAYDEHDESSAPGPVASLDWTRNLMRDWIGRDYFDKVIWGVATYGYDWSESGSAKPVSFEEALSIAKSHNILPSFDPQSSQLRVNYKDDEGHAHQIFLSDSASVFNTMRVASDFGIQHFALWRLGSMDQRVFRFFGKPLAFDDYRRGQDQFKKAMEAPSDASTVAQFVGAGEVLDVVSSPSNGHIATKFDDANGLIALEDFKDQPLPFVVQRYGASDSKDLVLTFDDGPDATFTPPILDILKTEGVPAVFFIVGILAEQNMTVLRRVYQEGHEIGNHTFTHPDLSKQSFGRIDVELNATRRLIEAVTGHTTTLFRPPFQADASPETYSELKAVSVGRKHRYYTVAESVDPRDWDVGVTSSDIVNRTLDELKKGGNIVLLHDAGGDRSATVEALPILIHELKSRGYRFVSLAKILGKNRDDLMPLLTKSSDQYFARFNWYFLSAVYFLMEVLFIVFISGILLSILRTVVIGCFAFESFKREKRKNSLGPSGSDDSQPPMSVIIPGFNEELNCVATVEHILRSNYSNFEVIFVDDGSTDATFDRVRRRYPNDPRVTVLSKPNGGKASALNFGLSHAKHEILVCIDADTVLDPDALGHLAKSMGQPGVVGCAGNVKVGNQKNFLTCMQALEYITSQNFDRRAFDYLNCILVVPGAIGAFRKSAVLRAGGWSSDTLAEDCELTVRLLADGGVIANNNKALAFTEAPETLRMFVKQRSRWAFGILQTLWKYRSKMFKNGTLGWVGLPNVLVFQLLMPLMAPLADFMLVAGIITGQAANVVTYYLGFLLVEWIGAWVAFSFEREKKILLLLLPVQRLAYRPVMYWVVIKAFASALKGELVNWNLIKRTGSVAKSFAWNGTQTSKN